MAAIVSTQNFRMIIVARRHCACVSKLESPLGKGNGRPVFRVVNNVHQVGLLSSRTLRVSKFWGYQGKQGIAKASMVSTVLTENVNKMYILGYLGGPEGGFNDQTAILSPIYMYMSNKETI